MEKKKYMEVAMKKICKKGIGVVLAATMATTGSMTAFALTI